MTIHMNCPECGAEGRCTFVFDTLPETLQYECPNGHIWTKRGELPDRPPIWDTATGHSLRRLLNEHEA